MEPFGLVLFWIDAHRKECYRLKQHSAFASAVAKGLWRDKQASADRKVFRQGKSNG
jgi:hypothetical protein